MKRELCIYCKMVDAIDGQMGAQCPNRDSLIRAPLLPGQECPMYRKAVCCPYHMAGHKVPERETRYPDAFKNKQATKLKFHTREKTE